MRQARPVPLRSRPRRLRLVNTAFIVAAHLPWQVKALLVQAIAVGIVYSTQRRPWDCGLADPRL